MIDDRRALARSRRQTRAAREARLAFFLLAPAAVLVLAVIGYPIINTIETAFAKTDPLGGITGFAGFGNFVAIFHDPVFLESVLRTAVWTVVVVGLVTLISLLVSLILYEDIAGSRLFQLILLLPWATAATMITIAWMWLINGQIGLLSETLQSAGWIKEPFGFLAYGRPAFIVAILIGTIVAIPFTTAVLSSGLSSIPVEIYDAGAIDGAAGWTRFRYLTIPFLTPFLTIATVINVIFTYNAFTIIWTLTEGGPNNATQIVVTYMFRTAFTYNHFGQAAAMSLLTFIILLGFSLVFALRTARGAQ